MKTNAPILTNAWDLVKGPNAICGPRQYHVRWAGVGSQGPLLRSLSLWLRAQSLTIIARLREVRFDNDHAKVWRKCSKLFSLNNQDTNRHATPFIGKIKIPTSTKGSEIDLDATTTLKRTPSSTAEADTTTKYSTFSPSNTTSIIQRIGNAFHKAFQGYIYVYIPKMFTIL